MKCECVGVCVADGVSGGEVGRVGRVLGLGGDVIDWRGGDKQ